LDACEDAEQPPSILDGSSVGPGARVIGDVTVGPNAMVAAGATVTMDVPGSHVATGVDTMLCVEEWLATFAELEPSLDEVQA
jgi:serine acetyltransferase